MDDSYFYGADTNLWTADNSDEELIPDNTPLYQNQLEDPVCRDLFDADLN